MSPTPNEEAGSGAHRPDQPAEIDRLVPRFKDQGYGPEQVRSRRRWVEEVAGCSLRHVSEANGDTESLRGNIENPIGTAQVPLGVAGPLWVHGEYAQGKFLVPLATSEGALVRSYERGMLALNRSGGVHTRVLRDENCVAPVFKFDTIPEALSFSGWLDENISEIRHAAESTTSHGKLLRLDSTPLGRDVFVLFSFSTGDAHGMNMLVKATDVACRWIVENSQARSFLALSGMSCEKRVGAPLLSGGKGKKVTAAALVPAKIVRSHLRTTPEKLREMWRQTILGQVQANVTGYNGHFANGLTALFIACGQDVANVVNSSVGVLNLEVTAEGDLQASLVLPSLVVATVGGGTALGTAGECLAILGCRGSGKARKLAEIAAATVLAGELSMGAALASGEFVSAHETYGRNRPQA